MRGSAAGCQAGAGTWFRQYSGKEAGLECKRFVRERGMQLNTQKDYVAAAGLTPHPESPKALDD